MIHGGSDQENGKAQVLDLNFDLSKGEQHFDEVNETINSGHENTICPDGV